VLYSAKHQFLFAHISRTGGTSLSDCLRAHCPDARGFGTQHIDLASVRAKLGPAFEPTFKFAFVRNPWDRMVSWYAMIGETQASVRDDQRFRNAPNDSHWQSFDTFLRAWLARQSVIDGVVRAELSQWAQLSDRDESLLVNELYRFEDFENGCQSILTRLGVQNAPVPWLNSARHLPYACYYTRFGRELVAQVLRTDIERLGYQYD
jgi:chondroitin 4-sulfotransferase 11